MQSATSEQLTRSLHEILWGPRLGGSELEAQSTPKLVVDDHDGFVASWRRARQVVQSPPQWGQTPQSGEATELCS